MNKIALAVALAAGMTGWTFAQPMLTEEIATQHKIVRTDTFYGFDRTVFDFDGYEAWVVEPKNGCVREGRPWTWTMQWATAFVARTGVPRLLADGYHHVTIITYKDKMDETGLAVSAKFQKYLVEELALAPKANLIGMSWGGFFSTRYAVRYPANVEKIYLDAPLLCFRDFDPTAETADAKLGPWALTAPRDGKWSRDPRMPVNLADRLAATGLPVFLVYGGQDDSCPPERNAIPFIERFKKAGGAKTLKVLYRSFFGHHPHGFELDDPTVVDFFEKPFVADAKAQNILGEVKTGASAQPKTTDGTALKCLTASGETPAAALRRFVDKGEIAGAVSMVAVSGRVETAYVGLADPTTGRKFDEKSLFWIASMTKGVCGAAVMSCVDRGLVSLDDPIEKYIPEIANVKVAEKGADGQTTLRPPKVKMTLRMCLSHVAGYPFNTPLADRKGAFSLSLADHVKGAVDCPLLWDPLTKHQYSNVDINLAGRVVEIVTGQLFEDYLQKTFLDPLGMRDTTFYPTTEQLSHKVYVARVENGKPYADGRGDRWAKPLSFGALRRGKIHAIAAGGLFATAADVMKFYCMLANDGKTPDGTRLLSHAAIVELSRAQYPELDCYTLGLRQFGDWFGHDGALQTEAYANWKERRAALLFVQITGPWNHAFKTAWRQAALGR